MGYMIIEYPTSAELANELNRLEKDGWKLAHFTVAPLGSGLRYIAVVTKSA